MKKVLFWAKAASVQILYLIAFFVGIFLFPVAYFLQYVVKVKKNPLSWFLNSTVDGDFGATWWREREGITKRNFWVALKWWWRNPTWNFRILFEEDSSKVFNIEVVKCTVPNLDYKIDYANRDTQKYGVNHVYYNDRNGNYHGRYSRASPTFELQMGADKFRLKFGKAE